MIGQQARFIALGVLHQPVQRFCRVILAVVLPETFFRDEFHHPGYLAVDPAAFGDATLGSDGVNRFFRHSHIFVEAGGYLKFAGVCQNKVAGGEVGDVFVQVKAAGQRGHQGQQRHGQPQREDGHRRLAAAAAEVGQGHAKGADRAGFASPAAPFAAALGVAQRLDRGDTGCHTSRPCTGEQNCNESEEGRPRKEQRADGYNRFHIVEATGHKRRQLTAHKPAQHEAEGDAHR